MKKKYLMSILINRNNDFFRDCFDSNDENYIYDSQINTARKIIMQLASDDEERTNHVMLLAPMQSGKTATCISVINIINKAKLYKPMNINKYFFITGMNDCGLKNQTFLRVKNQVIGANDNNITDNARKTANSKYFVFKNSDLLAYDGVLDNSLIFIDESHYGSNAKNVLTKFLEKHSINWKNEDSLTQRNIYIVSVSATPFDELVSDTLSCKKTVELDTDNTYVSVSSYLNEDVVFEADPKDICEEGAIFDYIMDAQWRMNDHHENGVIFIRTRQFDLIKENNFVKEHFDVFEMYASGSNIEYDTLNKKLDNLIENNANAKPLLVLIKGAFRAGITINKKYKDLIYMIFDYSNKADTTAQALLGRMCGYRSSNASISKTYFYLNKMFVRMYSDWENDFQNKELIPCNKINWDWTTNDDNEANVMYASKPCGNFTINLTDNEVADIYLLGKGKRNRVELMKDKIVDIFHKYNCDIPYDYIGEVQISGKNNYSKSSQEKRFNSFSEDSLVFQFRPEKMKDFIRDTNRNYLTREDLGKKCISIVLDAEIYDNDQLEIQGNKRLLIYYVEVGQKKMTYIRKGQYKKHKDTQLIDNYDKK